MKIVFSFLILTFTFQSLAGTREETAGKAAACIACHGANGISSNPLWPNIAGQKKDYLVKQLQAFKKGARVDPMMNPLAANLSEQDIEDLAHYFSAMK